MDKTGTLTIGRPEVTDVIALGGGPPAGVLRLAAALERRSQHPLAAGIMRAAAKEGIPLDEPSTDAAIEAAHVALMQDNWLVVPEAIAIGRRAVRTIKQNLWFTAAYNVVGILLAAIGWLPPVAAAAAQSLPDVAVMLNASRLLRRRDVPGLTDDRCPDDAARAR